MAIETLRPNGAGGSTQWTGTEEGEGAGTHWQKVDEAVADEDGTYVYSAAPGQDDAFALENSGVGAGTINSVTVYARGRKTTVDVVSIKVALWTGGSRFLSGLKTFAQNYEDHSNVWNQNPDTLAAWTWAEIDALQVGARTNAVDGGEARMTQAWIVVDYTAAGGVTINKGGNLAAAMTLALNSKMFYD